MGSRETKESDRYSRRKARCNRMYKWEGRSVVELYQEVCFRYYE